MKKFYYFSEKSLKFLEIKHFRAKLTAYFIASVVVFSSIIFGIVYFVSNLNGDGNKLLSLEKENENLKAKLLNISDNYNTLEDKLKKLVELSNDLRLAVNLEPISDEERLVGVGGSVSIDNLLNDVNPDVEKALKIVDEVTRKFEFEKSQFEEITRKLESNQKLYESIPAILPTNGNFSSRSYGMRMHPILHVRKMHLGIDIIANIGTPVKAAGKGKVTFVGYKEGFGLTVEIDHGFGYQTIYAHLSSAKIKQGKMVNRGDVIAKTGNSGLSTGPHLHYEVLHNGQNLNPAEFFFDEYNYFESTKIK